MARDLAPLGYAVTVFDGEAKAGGSSVRRFPAFACPESVIDEETGYVLNLGVDFKSGQRVESLRDLLGQGFDAIFVVAVHHVGATWRYRAPRGCSAYPYRH